MKPFNSNINFKFPIFQSPTQYTIPAISGENSGYHGNSMIIIRTIQIKVHLAYWIKTHPYIHILISVYVEVGKDASATATLDFSFGSSTIARSWEIKVTQLECSNPGRPYDSGCLQYFTGTTGRIESFNFPQTTTANQQHLHSQK